MLSIIIPVYNEADNIHPLWNQLRPVLTALKDSWEVIFINDGSSDDTAVPVDTIAASDVRVKALHFRRNFGQTAAMMAGIEAATGDIIVPMDGDCQNDPTDIPRLLAKIDEGFDVVSGWRKDRNDHPLRRNLPSFLANLLISFISGIKLNDYGCTLKAYRREVIKGVRLYGEMHRFIPIYASWQGARVTQIPVLHHARVAGKSKYGMKRTVKVILDLMVVKFLSRYLQEPMYVFGGFGLVSFALSGFSFLAMLYLKFWGGKSFIQTPLPLLTIFFILIGVISIFIGFLAQVVMMTYYESQNKKAYLIGRTTNMSKEKGI